MLSHFRIVLGLVVFVNFSLLGCSENEKKASSNSEVRQAKSLPYDPSIPLTKKEVEHFLQVVSQLPNQKVPEFYVSQESNTTGLLDAKSLIAQFRKEIESSLDAKVQKKAWERDPQLKAAFEKLNVDAEQFATLTTRLSFAYSDFALHGKKNFEEIKKNASRELAEAQIELEQLDAALQVERTVAWYKKRGELTNHMRFIVVTETFSGYLSQVPEKSRQSIRAYHASLARLLPDPKKTASLFDN